MDTAQQTTASIDALHTEYARVDRGRWFAQWYDRNALNLQWLRNAGAGDGRAPRVLELGIGWGGASICLAREGAVVVGLDDFSDGLETQGVPQMRFLESQRVRVVRGNLLELPIRPGSFDVVILNDVLEHMTVPKRVLETINDLLKPGGLLIMEVPNSVALYKRLRVLCGRSNYYRMEHFFLDEEYRGHIREYTKTEIAFMFERTGFTPLEIRGVNQAYRPWFESRTPIAAARPLLRLYAALTTLHDTWKDHYCCLARKDRPVARAFEPPAAAA